MISLENDRLTFHFPEAHASAIGGVEFQRTLRIPDDNREYLLPPGLGRFPLHHVDDYAHRLPAEWRAHGGVFLPMHQSEAMWISFRGGYPMAIKVAAGKINVLTGEAWTPRLCADPQDYLVVPGQPLAGRLLRCQGVDSTVRGNAARPRLHCGGATDRRG